MHRTLVPMLWAALVVAGEASWTVIDDRVLGQLPGYQPCADKHYDSFGHVWGVPATGDVWVFMNRNYGLLRSRDGAATWERVATPVEGRSFGAWGTDVDAATGRWALFNSVVLDKTYVNAGKPNFGVQTTDGGATFTPIPFRFDKGYRNGWSWGVADWSQAQSRTWLCKEQHTADMWLTQDAGATWAKLPFPARNFGRWDATTLVAAKQEYKQPQPESIWRSVDNGATWAQVADLIPNNSNPIRIGATWYWTTPKGLAASRDAGATWTVVWPQEALRYGPLQGRTPERLLVVGGTGLFRSVDAGVTWVKVADPPETDVGGTPVSSSYPKASFAWDDVRGVVVYAHVGRGLRCLPLP
jgi:photosystem II stability/assembly factor-like uncharacterized protein